MRAALLSLLFASTACTVDRVVPLSEFACAAGNGCDGGVVTRDGGDPKRDSGSEVHDAGVGEDVPTLDSGATPLPMCPGIVALPASGVASGSTNAANNGYEGGCFRSGGKDVVYGFTVPGRLAFLRVTTAGSAFDTTLHLYADDCTRPSQLVCTDETEELFVYEATAELRLEDVEPGSYAAIVDGFGPSESGDYLLQVSGAVAPGERCDPNQTFLPCQIGACAPDSRGELRCPAVLDCGDGIDGDGDGDVDEDADKCTNPPTVSCSPGPTAFIDSIAEPTASVVDDGTIVFGQWRVISSPFGSHTKPSPRDQEGTRLELDIAGTYRLRYTAADDRRQITACEVTIEPTTPPTLRAELIWKADGPRYASNTVFMFHLLHPGASAWFDERLDCSGPPCLDNALDWDRQGDFSDDPIWVGFFFGPQALFVDRPNTSGRYALGVETLDIGGDTPSPVGATVRIYCGGVLKEEIGPVLLNGSYTTPDLNDFWKVAELRFDSSGDCTVFPFGAGDTVVRTSQARSNR